MRIYVASLIAFLFMFTSALAFAQGTGGGTSVTEHATLHIEWCLARANGGLYCEKHDPPYATFALCEKAKENWTAQVPEDPNDPTVTVPLYKLLLETTQWETLTAWCEGTGEPVFYTLGQ